MKNLIISLILFSAPTAFAGEGSTEIKCQSSSGKTKVEIFTTDGGDAAMMASLRNADGKTNTKATFINKSLATNLELNGQTVEQVYPGAKVTPIVGLQEKHVIAFIAVQKDAHGYDSNPLKFVSVADSIQLKEGPYGQRKGTFQAILTGKDPRKSGSEYGSYLNEIKVHCTYDYSI